MSRGRFLRALGAAAAGVGLAGRAGRAHAMRDLPNTIYGTPLPSGYLRTEGSQIVGTDGLPVRLAGVNWYGFECSSMVAGGLDHQTIGGICRRIAALGFNVIRLPFSVQMVQDNPPITQFLDRNPGLRGKRALQIMDAVIDTAGAYGLRVVLDNHRSDAGWSTQSNGLWYTQQYPESFWIQTWQQITAHYASNPTVIGCDLRNEPGAPAPDATAWPANNGSLWGYEDPNNRTGFPADWPPAAERAGNAILDVNPHLLIFVEGVRFDPAGPSANNNLHWPGANLVGVGSPGGPRPAPVPVSLDVPGKLVYSVHDYGPDMYPPLPWCQLGSTASTPDACIDIWEHTWGYILHENIAPVWVGEFGTVNGYRPGDTTPKQYFTDPNTVNAQGAWFTYLVNYIAANNVSWCYWCLNGTQSAAPTRNPTLPDWYGVLDPTWSLPASDPLMAKLHTIQ